MDRRLPVYLLLDCSGSMVGDPIAAMQIGLSGLVSELRNDPYALETVWLGLITFASNADQPVPLIDIDQFVVPDLEAGGSTAMGDALALLEDAIRNEVRSGRGDEKADWKPMAFLFTDGVPTDSWRDPAERLRDSRICQLIVCGAGAEVNDATLHELSDTVIRLTDTQPGTLSTFLQWVTTSVTQTSKSLGSGRSAHLPDFDLNLDSGEIR